MRLLTIPTTRQCPPFARSGRSRGEPTSRACLLMSQWAGSTYTAGPATGCRVLQVGTVTPQRAFRSDVRMTLATLSRPATCSRRPLFGWTWYNSLSRAQKSHSDEQQLPCLLKVVCVGRKTSLVGIIIGVPPGAARLCENSSTSLTLSAPDPASGQERRHRLRRTYFAEGRTMGPWRSTA
jgi:hypothetical protein